MIDRRTDPSLQDLNRGMLVMAAALVVAGCVLGASGFALGAAAVVGAGRRWYQRALDSEPARETEVGAGQGRGRCRGGGMAGHRAEHLLTSLSCGGDNLIQDGGRARAWSD
jgi:hypothetical protein